MNVSTEAATQLVQSGGINDEGFTPEGRVRLSGFSSSRGGEGGATGRQANRGLAGKSTAESVKELNAEGGNYGYKGQDAYEKVRVEKGLSTPTKPKVNENPVLTREQYEQKQLAKEGLGSPESLARYEELEKSNDLINKYGKSYVNQTTDAGREQVVKQFGEEYKKMHQALYGKFGSGRMKKELAKRSGSIGVVGAVGVDVARGAASRLKRGAAALKKGTQKGEKMKLYKPNAIAASREMRDDRKSAISAAMSAEDKARIASLPRRQQKMIERKIAEDLAKPQTFSSLRTTRALLDLRKGVSSKGEMNAKSYLDYLSKGASGKIEKNPTNQNKTLGEEYFGKNPVTMTWQERAEARGWVKKGKGKKKV